MKIEYESYTNSVLGTRIISELDFEEEKTIYRASVFISDKALVIQYCESLQEMPADIDAYFSDLIKKLLRSYPKKED